MILKEKEFTNSLNPKVHAGEEAEKQMAFYLQRAFRKQDDCFVINDLRVIHDNDVAQIDHLIVSIYGLFIIESKSAHVISVDKNGHWQRTYESKTTGIPSPILQAKEQGRIIKELMTENRKLLLGKLLGMQKGFGYCPVNIYIAISNNGIIKQDIDIPELLKADAVTEAIQKQITFLKKGSGLFSPNLFSSENGWKITKQEAETVAKFLISRHTPLRSSTATENIKLPIPQPENRIEESYSKDAIPNNDINNEKSVTKPTNEEIPCPKCGTGHLVKRKGKSGKPDFFGCSNFVSSKCNYMKSIV